jgi:hypothetical protein
LIGGKNIYNIIDASLWSVNYAAQASGTRVKKWLIEPETNQLVLAKWPKIDTGEIYAEKVSSEIGRYINIPVMRAEIGILEGRFVVLAFNFLNTGEILLEGGDFFEEYDRERQRNRLPPNYTFQRIKAILEPESLISQFVDMLLLDCLIFNSDRHQDNWGICRKDGESRLAPVYDNGSSLGWNLTDHYLERMYNDPRQLEAFIQRASTHIGNNESPGCRHFELMQHLKQEQSGLFSGSLEKIEVLNEQSFQDIINDIPGELMSDLRKNIIIQVLLRRRNLMLEMR